MIQKPEFSLKAFLMKLDNDLKTAHLEATAFFASHLRRSEEIKQEGFAWTSQTTTILAKKNSKSM